MPMFSHSCGLLWLVAELLECATYHFVVLVCRVLSAECHRAGVADEVVGVRSHRPTQSRNASMAASNHTAGQVWGSTCGTKTLRLS